MEFRGICKNVDRIVVSDPSYGEDVWCRYESKNINGKDWRVQGYILDCSDEFDGFAVNGVEFFVGLSAPGEHLDLHEDGTFSHYERTSVKDFVIGMDTACVGFGLNEVADEIKASRDEWQPGCCLRTLTDGEFGSVYEGRFNGEVKFVVISGFLDEDTGYSKEDVLNYIASAFNVELERNLGIDEVLADAKDKSDIQNDGSLGEKDEMSK